jgi:predicted nucleic acid-binding protein
MRVLFDTNAIAYWIAGEARFKPALSGLLRKLRKQKASYYLSTVSIQEMLIFARITRTSDQTLQFLRGHFTVLPFDERAAIEAARIGAERPADKGAAITVRDVWQRDIAILGTASAHGLDMVVTANERDFAPYSELVSCEIHILRALESRRGN